MAIYPSEQVVAKKHPVEELVPVAVTAPVAVEEIVAAPEIPWQTLTVEPGDTLSHLFGRAGLNDNQIYKLLDSTPQSAVLTRLYPGQDVDFHLDDQGLAGLRLVKSPLQQLVFQRMGEQAFTVRRLSGSRKFG